MIDHDEEYEYEQDDDCKDTENRPVIKHGAMTHKQAIAKAFGLLRKRGYFARMNWQCCQNCGWHAVPTGVEKAVFYHAQDAEAFAKSGMLQDSIYIAWAGDGDVITRVMRDVGLTVTWSGSPDDRIEIIPVSVMPKVVA